MMEGEVSDPEVDIHYPKQVRSETTFLPFDPESSTMLINSDHGNNNGNLSKYLVQSEKQWVSVT